MSELEAEIDAVRRLREMGAVKIRVGTLEAEFPEAILTEPEQDGLGPLKPLEDLDPVEKEELLLASSG